MTSGPHILILSDFNVQNLARFLKKEIPGSMVTESPYGQLAQLVHQPEHSLWKTKYDLVLVWAKPGSIASSFPSTPACVETEQFVQTLRQVLNFHNRILFIDFELPVYFTGFTDQEEVVRIYEMNLLVRKNFQSLSSQPWLIKSGTHALDDKMWYLSKTPYHREVLHQAANTVASYWRGWQGLSKKLIVLDLDDTLWGGIVGDDGWQNLKLGGHDPVGEALADFQKKLLHLKNNGVMLAIVSKNDEQVALEAIRNHPEMVLKESDFSGYRINWTDKAANIASLVEELNIGMDSVVFLDDNPVERERVKTALPSVEVPELPDDKMLYPSFLRSLSFFNTPVLTAEDKVRTELYRQEKEREVQKTAFTSLDEWLESLQTEVTIEALSAENLIRATQLLNKTNQMNLRTRRMTEDELWGWAQQPGHHFFTVSVADKFGSAGLTGLISYSEKNGEAYIEDFVLSCRVMGRKIEEVMLAFAVHDALQNQQTGVVAEIIPTPKNNPCAAWWKLQPNVSVSGSRYIADMRSVYPESIRVKLIR